MHTYTEAVAEIRRIDREIDAGRAELKQRERIDLMSAESWQRTWVRHPDLAEREAELFRQRGAAQLVRDGALASAT